MYEFHFRTTELVCTSPNRMRCPDWLHHSKVTRELKAAASCGCAGGGEVKLPAVQKKSREVRWSTIKPTRTESCNYSCSLLIVWNMILYYAKCWVWQRTMQREDKKFIHILVRVLRDISVSGTFLRTRG